VILYYYFTTGIFIVNLHNEIYERRCAMGVEKAGEQYKCNICGNEVTVTKVGGGELVCCGEAMEKISG
jgi:desulfoferrodoxin-like iron-binding protein